MSKKTKNKWLKYFTNIGLKDEVVEEHLKYIGPLLDKGLPVIFDFNHLCKLLGRQEDYLASAINASAHHYRKYKIPKRRGGYRSICAPYPALLECQQWINKNILEVVSLHSAAHGFCKSRSILTNASEHLGKHSLLKIDLKDFFPSIEKPRIINVFRNLGYNRKVSFYLAALCCLDDCLPQGAASSPALSNIVSFGLDVRLSALAKSFDYTYSRYADDLTFSGNQIPFKFSEYVEEIVKSFGFEVNPDKTILKQGGGKKIVTGISVTNETPKLPRSYKRKLRQELFFIEKFGISSHIEKSKIKDPFYLDVILGRLSFWNFVEPENPDANKYIAHIKNLISAKSPD
jgi:hypothetical protein